MSCVTLATCFRSDRECWLSMKIHHLCWEANCFFFFFLNCTKTWMENEPLKASGGGRVKARPRVRFKRNSGQRWRARSLRSTVSGRLLPGHIFCLPLSLFSYYLKWPDFSLSFAPVVFFDIHLDWSFIKKAQTIEWLLIKSSSIWPLALYPSVPSLLLGRIHLFLN